MKIHRRSESRVLNKARSKPDPVNKSEGTKRIWCWYRGQRRWKSITDVKESSHSVAISKSITTSLISNYY